MARDKLIVSGLLTITVTAVVKTTLVNTYVGVFAEHGFGVLALVFLSLWLMTAALASLVFVVVSRSIEANRRAKIMTQIVNDPGKENMIECHAREWGLTKAETDVAIMVVKGFANAEIAAMRGSALQTVKSQLRAIYQKSGLEGRYQLMAFITDEVCETSRACCTGHTRPVAPHSDSPATRPRPRLVVDRDQEPPRPAAAVQRR